MLSINLLPWREELRVKRARDFLSAAAISLAAAALVVFCAHIYMEESISWQESRNGRLMAHSKVLDERIAKIRDLEVIRSGIIERMNVIDMLQRDRARIVHVMSEIPRIVPDGVYLLSMKKTGGEIVFSGLSQSNARVSAYMRNMDSSEWVGDPRLAFIESKKKVDHRGFSFGMKAMINGYKKEIVDSGVAKNEP